MRAEMTRYAVEGWGEGELWTAGYVVLAHDFTFKTVSDIAVEADATASRTNVGGPGRSGARTSSTQPESPCGENGTYLQQKALDKNRCLTPDLVVDLVRAFLRGEDAALADVPIDLGDVTPFQQAVVDALRRVPRGEVVTYGELAAMAGYPNAQRAAGSVCAHNPLWLFVPCHRVVSANGIGSYGSTGVAVKRRLLALEGIAL